MTEEIKEKPEYLEFWYDDPLAKNKSSRGLIKVDSTGLCLMPDDDYYHGLIPPAEAVKIARAILKRFVIEPSVSLVCTDRKSLEQCYEDLGLTRELVNHPFGFLVKSFLGVSVEGLMNLARHFKREFDRQTVEVARLREELKATQVEVEQASNYALNFQTEASRRWFQSFEAMDMFWELLGVPSEKSPKSEEGHKQGIARLRQELTRVLAMRKRCSAQRAELRRLNRDAYSNARFTRAMQTEVDRLRAELQQCREVLAKAQQEW